jgi:hypothetical protein
VSPQPSFSLSLVLSRAHLSPGRGKVPGTPGLTVADILNCADRLDLLEGDARPPYGVPGACARPTRIVQRRIAALDDEIARLTALRDQLAARIGAEPARTS